MTSEDSSGQIPPLPPQRDAIVRPNRIIGAAAALIVLTTIMWITVVILDATHTPHLPLLGDLFRGTAVAATITTMIAGHYWRDYKTAERIAGLYAAFTEDRHQQVEQMRQVVRDEVAEGLAKADWQVYARGWRDRELAEGQQKRSRVNGNVAYLPNDRRP